MAVISVALWPETVKRQGYALATIKRLVPSGIAFALLATLGVIKRRIGINGISMPPYPRV